jgi:hypothetical protein
MSLSRPAAVLAALLLSVVLAAPASASQSRAPRPPAAQGRKIVALVKQVTRDTPWKLVGQVHLQAETWHPEGLVRYGKRWIVSSVQVTEPTVKFPGGPVDNGTDRTPGAGFGHLMSFDAQGHLLEDRVLNAAGAIEYHPGGLDYDGRNVWVTLAQYRPASSATFLRVNPRTLAPTPILHAADHFGGVVHDTARRRLVTLNWGSRGGSDWRIPSHPHPKRFTRPESIVSNPSQFVDYQDCKYLGRVRAAADPLMLCGGITAYGVFQLGGIALLDTRTLAPVWEVPLTTLSPAGNVVTRNPIDVRVVHGKLRIALAPDDDSTTIFTYEAEL